MNESLYLLDGYSLVYRSYFAFINRPLMNPHGKNASAIFGFFRSLMLLLAERQPSHFAVVLDSRTPTFRHEKYEEYKANREKTPADLKNEIPVIEEICEKLGVPMVRVDGYEADDVMATLALEAMAEGKVCWVVSGDKDLLQLVDGSVKILKPETGGGFTEMDREAVAESWGVQPEQILDYLSLVGDSSDNVPGVKGIGAKTAAALLSEYPNLDEIYDHLDGLKSKSQQKKLTEGRENAFLSRELITLATEVPLPVSYDDLKLPELDRQAAAVYFAAEGMSTLVQDMIGSRDPGLAPDDPAVVRADLCARRQIDSWLENPNTTLDPSGATDAKAHVEQSRAAVAKGAAAKTDASAAAATVADSAPTRGATTAGPIERPALAGHTPSEEHRRAGEYELITSEQKLDQWVSRVRDARVVAFDTETTSLDAMQAQLVGLSLSVAAGAGCYVVLHGPTGPVLSAQAVRAKIKPLLEDPEIRVVGQNLKYDYKVMLRWGVRIANPWFDTMIAAWLLDTESNRLGMDALANDYLGYKTTHYDDIIPKPKKGEEIKTFDSVDLERAGHYAAEDADITFRLHELFSGFLKERGLEELFFELEMPLLPILAEMEVEGIRVDVRALAEYSKELERELGQIEREIYTLVGHEFNIGSTKQLQEVLFEERKLTPVKKTKTGYSTDTSVLQELAAEDPVPSLVLRHRTLAKLKSTYVDSLPSMVNPETGRIHTHFNLTGTATGRMSSTDPNLQNIPIRDEEGRRIRSAFVPREGWSFVSADYSQLELVILAHLSDDPGLKRAFAEGIDVHRHTGSLLFGVEANEVTSQQRRIAKTINFGVMYGMSAFRLSRELGVPQKEAASFIDSYFKTYSRIKGFIDETVIAAEQCGYVTTILGRKRYLANISNQNRTVKMASERIAVNTPIQGSGSDIIKKAMLALHAELSKRGLAARMLLQVHDELILEAPPEEVEEVSEILKQTMSEAITLSVPLKVSVESGSSWGEMH
ncbi:MAG: DNA polymerase I [Spirochaetales bacterium]